MKKENAMYFILGVIVASIIINVYAESYYEGKDITYDNTKSGLTSTTVQDAVDEINTIVSDGKDLISKTLTTGGVTTLSTDTFETINNNIGTLATNKYIAGQNSIKDGTQTKLTQGTWSDNKMIVTASAGYNASLLTTTVDASSLITDLENVINEKKYVNKLTNLLIKSGSYTIDLNNYLSDCTNFTTTDFYYIFTKFVENGPSGKASGTTPTIYKSYNSSTCVFTYGRSSVSNATPYIYVDLYVIY